MPLLSKASLWRVPEIVLMLYNGVNPAEALPLTFSAGFTPAGITNESYIRSHPLKFLASAGLVPAEPASFPGIIRKHAFESHLDHPRRKSQRRS
jgi:hypothetical protein